jgi:hypothetical protein
MLKTILLLLLPLSAWATTKAHVSNGCTGNIDQLSAVIASDGPNRTIDFFVAVVNTSGTGTAGDITVAPDSEGNVYTDMLNVPVLAGTYGMKFRHFRTITTTPGASITITAAVTTPTLNHYQTCAIQWSDKFNLTFESTPATQTWTTGVNVPCTGIGSAPNQTITPAKDGDMILVLGVGWNGFAGFTTFTKAGSDVTQQLGPTTGNSIGAVGGWGISYLLNATANSTYVAGFTTGGSAANPGKCVTVVSQLDQTGVVATPAAVRHLVRGQ